MQSVQGFRRYFANRSIENRTHIHTHRQLHDCQLFMVAGNNSGNYNARNNFDKERNSLLKFYIISNPWFFISKTIADLSCHSFLVQKRGFVQRNLFLAQLCYSWQHCADGTGFWQTTHHYKGWMVFIFMEGPCAYVSTWSRYLHKLSNLYIYHPTLASLPLHPFFRGWINIEIALISFMATSWHKDWLRFAAGVCRWL